MGTHNGLPPVTFRVFLCRCSSKQAGFLCKGCWLASYATYGLLFVLQCCCSLKDTCVSLCCNTESVACSSGRFSLLPLRLVCSVGTVLSIVPEEKAVLTDTAHGITLRMLPAAPGLMISIYNYTLSSTGWHPVNVDEGVALESESAQACARVSKAGFQCLAMDLFPHKSS